MEHNELIGRGGSVLWGIWDCTRIRQEDGETAGANNGEWVHGLGDGLGGYKERMEICKQSKYCVYSPEGTTKRSF